MKYKRGLTAIFFWASGLCACASEATDETPEGQDKSVVTTTMVFAEGLFVGNDRQAEFRLIRSACGSLDNATLAIDSGVLDGTQLTVPVVQQRRQSTLFRVELDEAQRRAIGDGAEIRGQPTLFIPEGPLFDVIEIFLDVKKPGTDHRTRVLVNGSQSTGYASKQIAAYNPAMSGDCL